MKLLVDAVVAGELVVLTPWDDVDVQVVDGLACALALLDGHSDRVCVVDPLNELGQVLDGERDLE